MGAEQQRRSREETRYCCVVNVPAEKCGTTMCGKMHECSASKRASLMSDGNKASRNERLVEPVREAMTKAFMKLSDLAERAQLSERTVSKFLNGDDVRPITAARIYAVFGWEPPKTRGAAAHSMDIADDYYGGYARSMHDAYSGVFACYRRSFVDPKKIITSVINVEWVPEENDVRYGFTEYLRYPLRGKMYEETFSGEFYAGPLSSLVHLVSAKNGDIRTYMLSKMRTSSAIMRGTLTTHIESRDRTRIAISPVVFEKLPGGVSFDHAKEHVADLKEPTEEHDYIYEELDFVANKMIFRPKIE
jgi:transcriptional regulator with XRE-family HTH domain